MMKKIKMFIAIYSLGMGGGEKALVNMLNSLSPDQYEIDLQLFEKKGPNLAFVPSWVNILNPLFAERMPSSKQQIMEYMKKDDFVSVLKKIILLIKGAHANEREKTFLAWKAMRKLCRRNEKHYDVAVAAMHGLVTYYTFDSIHADKKICWVHTDYSKISRVEADQKYFMQADRVIAVSEQCEQALKQAFPALNNIQILYNLNCPQLINQMASEKTRQMCFEKKSSTNILSIGRLIPLKGFDMAIQAAAILKQKGYSFEWIILGDGTESQKLEEQARESGVEEYLHFNGVATNPYPYMENADIIVQTSRYEGKSMVLDEAKILHKPIVVTAYDSAADQITDGKNGLIVPINPEGIAAGIERMMTDRQLREDLKNRLKLEGGDQRKLIEQYDKLFMEN